MLKALVLKELRETGWIALVGLAAHLSCVANYIGYPVSPFAGGTGPFEVPFYFNDPFVHTFCLVSIALAIGLGFRQTAVESSRGTWLFLLHRPASMRRVLAAKLAVGGGLYLLCGLIPILSYAIWASIPGKHPGPFFWWLTADAWKAWGLIGTVYLGAFLAGIRQARWFGSRLLPLVAGGVLAALLVFPMVWPWLGAAVLLAVVACLIGLIDFTARTRDFS